MSNYTDTTRKLVNAGFYDEPDKIDFAIDECIRRECVMPKSSPADQLRVRPAGTGDGSALYWGDLGERGAGAGHEELEKPKPVRGVFWFYIAMILFAAVSVAALWEGN